MLCSYDRRLSLLFVYKEDISIAPGMEDKLEQAEEYRFVYIASQKLSVRLIAHDKCNEGTALAGELFLVPAGAACELVNGSPSPCEVVVIGFTFEKERRPNASSGKRPLEHLEFHAARLPQMNGILHEFASGEEQAEPAVFYEWQSNLYAIASGYLRSLNKPGRTESDLQLYVERSQQLMLERYPKPVDIEELVRSSGFSVSRFYQAFRTLTGLSPHKYLTKLRLDASLRLLASQSSSVVECAHAVGYPDEYYFSRLFKKHMGLTPTEYAQLAGIRLANLSPVFLGDLSALGITPYMAFQRGWQELADETFKQLAAAKPELILTGPVDEEHFEALSRIAPVMMLNWKTYSWKERLLLIAERLGLTSVAVRWLEHYDSRISNARVQVRNSLGQEPVLLVQVYEGGYRVFGMRWKKMTDLFYNDLQVAAPECVRDLRDIETPSMEDIAGMDCDSVLFLVPAGTTEERLSELESTWRSQANVRPKKRCLFVQYPQVLNYNASIHGLLVDETVQLLLRRA